MIDIQKVAIKWAKKRFYYLQKVDIDFKYDTQHIDFESDAFWTDDITSGLPEFSVASIAKIYFDLKGTGNLSNQEIYNRISSVRKQIISSFAEPNDILDFIVKQLQEEFYHNPEIDFRIGDNGFTINHIRQIIDDVKERMNKEERYQFPDHIKQGVRNDEEIMKKANRAKLKKEAKDYGKLWIGALAMGATVFIASLTGSFIVLIVLGLIVGIILSSTLFKDIQG
jgi:hypothetical protein